MFKIFKSKKSVWKVTFRNSKGFIRMAKIKAESRLTAYYEMERIFGKRHIIDVHKA